jgi:hypothetical protein
MTAPAWPQPFEGIRGTEIRAWLLSTDERAVVHREALIDMARHLQTATLVGDPAPVVRRMSDALRNPLPGDLVVTREVMLGTYQDPDRRLKGFGLYLRGRQEWATSDADWEAYKAEDGCGLTDADRMTDNVFYIQYGPDPGDVCRWHDSRAIVLPAGLDGFGIDGAAERTETEDGRTRRVFTRESLTGALADSGFLLRDPLTGDFPEPLLEDSDLLVTVRVPGGQITRVEEAVRPGSSGTVR